MRDYGFSPAQQDEIWRRWRAGESFNSMGRVLGMPMHHVRSFLAQTGGIRHILSGAPLRICRAPSGRRYPAGWRPGRLPGGRRRSSCLPACASPQTDQTRRSPTAVRDRGEQARTAMLARPESPLLPSGFTGSHCSPGRGWLAGNSRRWGASVGALHPSTWRSSRSMRRRPTCSPRHSRNEPAWSTPTPLTVSCRS